uniref:hypothetical protein n=1 Tax=Nonomuraea sp. CA-252377 TaxID=3240003 RepID=UPI003F499568
MGERKRQATLGAVCASQRRNSETITKQEAAQQGRVQEKEFGKRLPAGSRVPVCPTCKSFFLQVAYTGLVVHALVNTADPAAGVQDVVVDPDVAQLEKVAWVRCAFCFEPLADGPRRPGSPARRADRAAARPGPRRHSVGEPVGVPDRDHRRRTRAAARRAAGPR